MKDPRPIQSHLKSKRIVWEEEKPLRHSYMKILRETSNLRREYSVNPYAEVYQMKENCWAIFTESLDGAGDPWMFLIEGPKKAMLIDTGFGVGDLKGLVKEIIGNKEYFVVNTHSHYDHAYGNAQFERCYCHEYEVARMQAVNNDRIWDYLFDETGKCKWTEFDRQDIIDYHPYEIVGIKDGYRFDLGGSYEIEAVLMPGHTPGQCAYLDHHHHAIFIGDICGIGRANDHEPFKEMCTVTALRDSLKKLQPRFDEIEGVFPGHGMLDISSISLQYTLDACEAILRNPDCYDEIKEKVFPSSNKKIQFMMKYIYQGSAIRYTSKNIK